MPQNGMYAPPATGGQSSGTDFLPSDTGPLYVAEELIYLGSTEADMSAAAPSITGLNPTGAGVGTSGTITVGGTDLLDICTGNTTVSITGSGVTLGINSIDATEAVLTYSITTNASATSRTLTLTTCFGPGSASFQVGDPTPVITQVAPNNWPAGVQTSFTISGSGFGTAPTLAVTGNGVTASGISSSTDTQINATVTIAANAPAGIATITVTSTGYYGSGFVSTGGSTNSATAQATINATQGTAPTIVWGPDAGGNGSNCGGTNIATSNQNVVVGQQIAFTACYSLPQGATIISESWSPPLPSGTVVAGYNASTSGGAVVPFQSTTCAGSGYCDFPTFYWVDTGGDGTRFTFNYMYGLNNSVVYGSSFVDFSVSGPTDADVGAPTSQMNIWPGPQLQFGGPSEAGIYFWGSANYPPGNGGIFSWVQLINRDENYRISGNARWRCIPLSYVTDSSPELDNLYPIATGDQFGDSPSAGLDPDDGEFSRNLSATTYFMWTPIADSRCTSGAACTIPVPLGYVSWQFCGDAINTLADQDNSTKWIFGPHNGQSETPSPAQFHRCDPTDPILKNNCSYPTWTKTLQNGWTLSQSCKLY